LSDGSAYPRGSPFEPAEEPPLLERALPVSGELPRYRTRHARHDLLAGVTVAALALPSAMAYGELAGLSPVNGLYALLLPTVVYVLLGSSRQLVIGPEGSRSMRRNPLPQLGEVVRVREAVEVCAPKATA
jgi:sulfate permease, SulP family